MADRKVELLLAGFYEPVLASLPRADRVEQIQWMHDAVRRRFGVDARGLWLTERVWEPELAADLADAGVRYALVDDRHFLVSGFASEQLHAPFWTESDGKRVALFPIDERLRYLIPFRPPEETAAYLRELRGAGHRLGGSGRRRREVRWLAGDQGMGLRAGMAGSLRGDYRRADRSRRGSAQHLERCTGHGAQRRASPTFLSASYREMEGWSLPPDAALRLIRLERDLGEARHRRPRRRADPRSAHWRNFLVKYSESNRMHKKMQALSLLCRAAGDPPPARRAIGRAQCNDAYWHGVFGGLYLPHLREAIWQNLAQAERELRQGQGLAAEILDIDGDGHDEIWIHSDQFSAIVSPAPGRRGRGVHHLRHRDQLRQHADPPPGGVPRNGAGRPCRGGPWIGGGLSAAGRRRSRFIRGSGFAQCSAAGRIRQRRLLAGSLLGPVALPIPNRVCSRSSRGPLLLFRSQRKA